MKKYAALIIDLKKSRSYSIAERNLIQQKIMETLHKLNRIFSKSLEKEVEFSAGDEMQGLFTFPEAAYLYLRLFQMMTHPVELWSGIGIGKWDVVLKNASTTAQDGSSYHHARKAVNEAKNSFEYSSLLFSGEKQDLMVNSLIGAISILVKKQSEYQNRLMLLSELLYPINTGNILDENSFHELFDQMGIHEFLSSPIDAEEKEETFFIIHGKKRGLSTQLSDILEISRQSIEKSIKAANIYEIRNLVIALLHAMKEYNRGELI